MAVPKVRGDTCGDSADPGLDVAMGAGYSRHYAHLDIYGHTMMDTGYDTGQSDPNWFDYFCVYHARADAGTGNSERRVNSGTARTTVANGSG